ncbi:MAG: hypothetical protein ISQ27_02975 [PS1 clade bacterium]|nr:hypothetical protein [PS1 clade bacterium]
MEDMVQVNPLLNSEAAIAFCLLAVAQADGPTSDAEISLIIHLLAAQDHGATQAPHKEVPYATLALSQELLGAEDGLDSGLAMVCAALDSPHRAQAYALAADFVMLNACVSPEEIRLLDILAENFCLTPLTRAAIDKAAQIRLAPELGHYD